MQHTLTTISTQSDINKVMQPHSAQNMVSSNIKEKKHIKKKRNKERTNYIQVKIAKF